MLRAILKFVYFVCENNIIVWLSWVTNFKKVKKNRTSFEVLV